MVELNLAGWVVVVLPGLAIGTLMAIALRRPRWPGALTGAATSWLVAVTIDTLRYRRSDIGFVLDVAGEVEAQRIADDLRTDGIEVSVEKSPIWAGATRAQPCGSYMGR